MLAQTLEEWREAEFTFQYVSINIQQDAKCKKIQAHLHSNMSLLILYYIPECC